MKRMASKRNRLATKRAGRIRLACGGALFAILTLAGCKDSSGPPEDRVATIEIVSGDQQQAPVGTALPLPLVIRAVDAQSKPVGGATIEWDVAEANGSVTPASTVTADDGRASASWTIGNSAIEQSLTIRIKMVAATMRATGLAGPATTVTVTPATVVLDAIGASASLTATAKDAHDNPIAGRSFAWTSSDGAVASVDPTGRVQAAGPGTAKVRATLDGSTGEADVMVQPLPATISLDPPSAQFTTVGATVQFTISAKDRNGFTITLPATAYTWTTTDPSVVTVDASGLATSKGSGAALVRASLGNASGQAQVTVQQTATTVSVTPAADTLTTAKPSVQLMVDARDANDQPILVPSLMWATSDAAVANVTSTGLVTAVANGTAIIRVNSGAAKDSATIVVRLNAPAVAVIDSLASLMNTSLVITAPGLLGNDTLGVPTATIVSFGGGSLPGSVATNPVGSTVTFGTGGSLRVSADGSLTFTPSTGFTGSFTFQYRLQNSVGTSDATVVIEVGLPPVAVDDGYATTMNVALTVNPPGVLTNDNTGFPLSVVMSFGGGSLPGTVTSFPAGQGLAFGIGGFLGGFIRLNADGSLSFTPPTGYTGTFTVLYRISNGVGTSDATISITVS
jgi:Bacterial Ig-like domain (group 2)/Bacterial Ig domain